MDIDHTLRGRDEIPLAEFAALRGETRRAVVLRHYANTLGYVVRQARPGARLMVPASEVRRWHAEREATGVRLAPGQTLNIVVDGGIYALGLRTA